jgi:GNAT superfamily N-acetyltransferase
LRKRTASAALALKIERNSSVGEKVARASARQRRLIRTMQIDPLPRQSPHNLRPPPAPCRIPFRYGRLKIVEGPLSEAQWDCMRAFVRDTERDDLRRRFGAPLALDDEFTLRRAFGIKSGGEMLWSLDDEGAIAGICHCILVSAEEAETALIIRSDLKGFGIGEFLLRTVLARAARQGLRTVSASMLRDNAPMLRLAMKVGCVLREAHGETIEIAFNVR